MKLLYKVQSDKQIDQVIIDLKTSLSKHKFGVLWEMNFKDTLKNKGIEFNKDFFVFEVCNPQQAKNVLDHNLETGFFLPCKLVIYKENSNVYIGMIKPTKLISALDDTELNKVALTIEEALIDAINIAK
ncbi:MAG: DUF302 domain-containing protein [Tenericutes bacterium]|jgi:uncharacterized protein (DUF302 family)|nr:DUF302 domain-containing protein [Mycoplasmatota bacterium]